MRRDKQREQSGKSRLIFASCDNRCRLTFKLFIRTTNKRVRCNLIGSLLEAFLSSSEFSNFLSISRSPCNTNGTNDKIALRIIDVCVIVSSIGVTRRRYTFTHAHPDDDICAMMRAVASSGITRYRSRRKNRDSIRLTWLGAHART